MLRVLYCWVFYLIQLYIVIYIELEHLHLLFCELLDCCPCIHTFCPNHFSSECWLKNQFPSPQHCWLCQFFRLTPLIPLYPLHHSCPPAVLRGTPRFVPSLLFIDALLTPALLIAFAKLDCPVLRLHRKILLLSPWRPFAWEDFSESLN